MRNYVETPFGKMNFEDVKKVAIYFNEHGASMPTTCADIGVSAPFMSSLVNRGYVRVVGKKDNGFYPVGDGLYRKNTVNLYVLTITANVFWQEYEKSVEKLALSSKSKAQEHIATAQALLNDAQHKLDSIGKVII